MNDGYIYVHDMGHRRDTINCCLFDMEKVLAGGFDMGDMWYDEPRSLSEAFDVMASVSINAAAQIYGGFTIAQIDELLVKYAKKSFDIYVSEYRELGMEEDTAASLADKRIEKDFETGFGALEAKFNSMISPRGDYPFITISFGIGRDKYWDSSNPEFYSPMFRGMTTKNVKIYDISKIREALTDFEKSNIESIS